MHNFRQQSVGDTALRFNLDELQDKLTKSISPRETCSVWNPKNTMPTSVEDKLLWIASSSIKPASTEYLSDGIDYHHEQAECAGCLLWMP